MVKEKVDTLAAWAECKKKYAKRYHWKSELSPELDKQGYWKMFLKERSALKMKFKEMAPIEAKWKAILHCIREGFEPEFIDQKSVTIGIPNDYVIERNDRDAPEIIWWILENIGRPNPNYETCPHNIAKLWLNNLTEGTENQRKSFVDNYFPRLMPREIKGGGSTNVADQNRKLRFVDEIKEFRKGQQVVRELNGTD